MARTIAANAAYPSVGHIPLRRELDDATGMGAEWLIIDGKARTASASRDGTAFIAVGRDSDLLLLTARAAKQPAFIAVGRDSDLLLLTARAAKQPAFIAVGRDSDLLLLTARAAKQPKRTYFVPSTNQSMRRLEWPGAIQRIIFSQGDPAELSFTFKPAANGPSDCAMCRETASRR